MPEATVYEYHQLFPGKTEIGFSWKWEMSSPTGDPPGAQHARQDKFG
jgi:hypothetical protein